MVLRNVRVLLTAISLAVAFVGIGRAQTRIDLFEAIRLSGDHSSNLGSLRHDSLAAQYDLAAARALRYPTLSATATSYFTDVVQKIETPFASIELGSKDNYQADMRLTLPLYAGGRISNQVRVQSSLAYVRGYNLAAARLQNAYLTRRAYLGLMLAVSSAATAEASLRRVDVLNRDISNLFAAGLADSVDVLDAQSALLRATQALDERRTVVENALSLLARLIGLPKSEFVLADKQMPEPVIEPYENAGPIPEKFARPELSALESRVDASRHSIGLSRAAYLPSLHAFGGYTVGKPGRDLANKDWNDYWTVGVNLNWEFNLGLRAFRGVSSAREGMRATEMARDDLEESIRLATLVAYDNLRLAFQNYGISQREYRIAERKYALGGERRRAGTLSVNRLIELEQDLAAAEHMQKSAIINYYLAETEYFYAIGSDRIYGGF